MLANYKTLLEDIEFPTQAKDFHYLESKIKASASSYFLLLASFRADTTQSQRESNCAAHIPTEKGSKKMNAGIIDWRNYQFMFVCL